MEVFVKKGSQAGSTKDGQVFRGPIGSVTVMDGPSGPHLKVVMSRLDPGLGPGEGRHVRRRVEVYLKKGEVNRLARLLKETPKSR